MSEDLDDGEFWLPSHFLTDDDVLMDFSGGKGRAGIGLDLFSIGSNSGSNSDLDFSSGSLTGSTETESDEEELLAELTRRMAGSVINDSKVFSSSPKSTLCGYGCKQGSSRGSPNDPVSPPPPTVAKEAEKDDGTLELLHEAAGEVAKMKSRSRSEAASKVASTGTGFFDCSTRLLKCPPPPTKTTTPPMSIVNNYPTLYSQPPFQPFFQIQQLRQYQQQQMAQKRATPLGLPPSAWPPLQARPPAHRVPNLPVGPNKQCVGTGVFLPRRVNGQTETKTQSRKKPDVNAMKTRNGKGSKSQQRKSSTTSSVANNNEIQLPQEWTY